MARLSFLLVTNYKVDYKLSKEIKFCLSRLWIVMLIDRGSTCTMLLTHDQTNFWLAWHGTYTGRKVLLGYCTTRLQKHDPDDFGCCQHSSAIFYAK